jgi:hypothetical protein
MTGSLDCDKVFEILTRGPFPAGGAEDVHVERHLSICHECRQLAEALRPAVGLFHEALEYDASHTLPAYQGVLTAATSRYRDFGSMDVTERVPPEVEASAKQIRFLPSFHDSSSHLVAVPLIIIAVLAVLWSPLRRALTDHLPAGGLSPTSVAAAFRPDDDGLRLLNSISVPLACFNVSGSADGSRDGQSTLGPLPVVADRYLCCTQCHSAASPHRPPIDQIAAVVGACRGCHN